MRILTKCRLCLIRNARHRDANLLLRVAYNEFDAKRQQKSDINKYFFKKELSQFLFLDEF